MIFNVEMVSRLCYITTLRVSVSRLQLNIPFAPLPPSQRQYNMRNVNPKTI